MRQPSDNSGSQITSSAAITFTTETPSFPMTTIISSRRTELTLVQKRTAFPTIPCDSVNKNNTNVPNKRSWKNGTFSSDSFGMIQEDDGESQDLLQSHCNWMEQQCPKKSKRMRHTLQHDDESASAAASSSAAYCDKEQQQQHHHHESTSPIQWWKKTKKQRSARSSAFNANKASNNPTMTQTCHICRRNVTPLNHINENAYTTSNIYQTKTMLSYYAPVNPIRVQSKSMIVATTNTNLQSSSMNRLCNPPFIRCTFCERSNFCNKCLQDCEVCQLPFCNFCCTSDRFMRRLCLECCGMESEKSAMEEDKTKKNDALQINVKPSTDHMDDPMQIG